MSVERIGVKHKSELLKKFERLEVKKDEKNGIIVRTCDIYFKRHVKNKNVYVIDHILFV